MQKGHIGVTTENIFPIIKKYLYSDHEIFLRELVSNAVDASQKLRTLFSVGEFKGELGDLTVRVHLDEKAGTITISDRGIGMTADEIDKYINQLAFSGANDFLEKYKNDANAIIGHFGLGFYSSFMVSKKVEIHTLSFREGAKAVKWSCDGSPEFTLQETPKADRGTDIILHIDDENKQFLQKTEISRLLKKYCRFLPVEIAFGKKTEWKDGKSVETDQDDIVNETNPLWTRKPADLNDEDYTSFYSSLYPMSEDPLFNIHLNVDYPFNLTGVLYFPKIKNNIEVQKNKIQLYCNQVYVTDSVEGIVPEFLTLLHGVLDSPDIPLNVSRSYLQSDSNVKKISSHITKKVADRLEEIFKKDRKAYEEKWDNLRLFIQYGMLTDEKFAERAQKFALLKNIDGKYFTFEEYKELIKANQTDKDDTLVYLYANDQDQQHSFIEAATAKGYDVLVMDGQLDTHFINHLEQKFEKSRFTRVDSDIVEKLVPRESNHESKLSQAQREDMTAVFNAQLPKGGKTNFYVSFENVGAEAAPIIITQQEFMRRMKEMSAMQGGAMSFYGEMPDSYNLIVNEAHPLVARVISDAADACNQQVESLRSKLQSVEKRREELNKGKEGKKDDEVPQAIKDELADVDKKIAELNEKREGILGEFGKDNKLISQLIDLALLSNNMLKGEALTKFVKRSIELI
ncbi:molecular chaperone HtpG [Breznakibacter xylanolyticus]|uniref:Chaperone protein HtpG n=1 Tax=Breznakibacter xylanolyticus TaxID=990 RepID=A0A2W7PLI2_9BACT|nr:molecular chaperone HtpG [Breznakibacter xylanolyticus]PZX10159.1 molecular chaperone HtpG [Breznakibacter xylanolyticus]